MDKETEEQKGTKLSATHSDEKRVETDTRSLDHKISLFNLVRYYRALGQIQIS